MRILLVSDLHYTLPQFDWVVGVAADFDLVVLAGDHLDISSTVPLATQCVVVGNYLELIAARAPVVASSGNHDLTGPDGNGELAALWLDDARPRGVPTDGDSVRVTDDVLVTVCPWWEGPVGRAELGARLAADGAARPQVWIWVYHWPPTDSPTSWTGRRYYGDAEVAAWIGEHRPDLVLSGHVHGPPFQPQGSWVDRIDTTWVFNPGRQTGPVPTRVEIDLTEQTARWVSLMGAETVDLTAAELPPRSLF